MIVLDLARSNPSLSCRASANMTCRVQFLVVPERLETFGPVAGPPRKAAGRARLEQVAGIPSPGNTAGAPEIPRSVIGPLALAIGGDACRWLGTAVGACLSAHFWGPTLYASADPVTQAGRAARAQESGTDNRTKGGVYPGPVRSPWPDPTSTSARSRQADGPEPTAA